MSDAPTPPNLDPDVARIFQELERQKKPRAALGRVLGLDPKQMNRLANGERRLQRHEHQDALEFLGISGQLGPEGVVRASHHGGTILPMPNMVPLFGWVGAATASRLTIADQNLRGYVPMHPNQAGVRDAFALEVADVSMVPRYEPGEKVYLAPNRWPLRGQDCVAVTTSDEGLLKRFVQKDLERLVLHQLNPDSDIEIALKDLAQIHTVVGRG